GRCWPDSRCTCRCTSASAGSARRRSEPPSGRASTGRGQPPDTALRCARDQALLEQRGLRVKRFACLQAGRLTDLRLVGRQRVEVVLGGLEQLARLALAAAREATPACDRERE